MNEKKVDVELDVDKKLKVLSEIIQVITEILNIKNNTFWANQSRSTGIPIGIRTMQHKLGLDPRNLPVVKPDNDNACKFILANIAQNRESTWNFFARGTRNDKTAEFYKLVSSLKDLHPYKSPIQAYTDLKKNLNTFLSEQTAEMNPNAARKYQP